MSARRARIGLVVALGGLLAARSGDAAEQRQGGRIAVAGDLWAVTQPAAHAVLLYEGMDDGVPRLVASLVGEGGRPGQFLLPDGVAIDAERSRLYVTDGQADRLQAFEIVPASAGAAGRLRFAKAVGRRGAGAGEFDRPGGIAVAPDGRVFVADAGNHRVQVFDTMLRPAGDVGVGVLGAPIDLVVDGARLLVLDAERLRVEVFGLDGRWMSGWGERVAEDRSNDVAAAGFRGPFGIAVDTAGAIVVSDVSRHVVQRLDASGRRLGGFGGYGSADGRLFAPMGVAVDARGAVLVLDRRCTRLQIFSADGTHRRSIVLDAAAVPGPVP